jgi:hypothetical protein
LRVRIDDAGERDVLVDLLDFDDRCVARTVTGYTAKSG